MELRFGMRIDSELFDNCCPIRRVVVSLLRVSVSGDRATQCGSESTRDLSLSLSLSLTPLHSLSGSSNHSTPSDEGKREHEQDRQSKPIST